MVGMGYYEVQAHSMIGEKLLNDCNIEVGEHIKIINAQAPEKEYMRMSLVPSLIHHARENQKVKSDVKLFEIQKVYHKNNKYKQEDRLDQYAFEPQQITAVWSSPSGRTRSVPALSPSNGSKSQSNRGVGLLHCKRRCQKQFLQT